MAEAAPIACSLSGDELPERAAQMARLGRNSLAGLTVKGSSATLRFHAGTGTETALADFIAAESACCPFFRFDTDLGDGEILLLVEAPADADWAVRGLVAAFVAGWGVLV